MSHLGFIGAGQMAKALAAGVCSKGLASPAEVVAADISPEARTAFMASVPGADVTDKIPHVVQSCEIIVLAVKPQHLAEVCETIRPEVRAEQVFVSIAAGVPLASLTHWLGTERVIRVMPNTPCLVAEGASAFCSAAGATTDDVEQVRKLLAAVGTVAEVPERLMDAVTGLSGSGPAYIYLIVEALADAGTLQGLPRDTALALAAQTVLGAAKMVRETGEHPAVLKERVSSPGGTTIHGLQALEDQGVRAAILSAVERATHRSQELGRS